MGARENHSARRMRANGLPLQAKIIVVAVSRAYHTRPIYDYAFYFFLSLFLSLLFFLLFLPFPSSTRDNVRSGNAARKSVHDALSLSLSLSLCASVSPRTGIYF